MTWVRGSLRSVLPGALSALVWLAGASAAQAQSCGLSAPDAARFRAEHLSSGPPTSGAILVRRGYVAQHDAAHRIPKWVAWHAVQDYRNDVDRRGKFKTYRTDRETTQPVADREYNGQHYDRGHIAPYFIGGGDRDRDGKRAQDPPAPSSDPFDECTIFEINYFSNLAPQLHSFNGSGGLWYKLETIERQTLLPRGVDLHIIGGSIVGPTPFKIGPNHDIAVPDMFYRILITDRGVVPFLFVHKARIGTKGCALTARLETCIVTVADIERVTGADFFSGLSDSEEAALEAGDGLVIWRALVAVP